MEEYHDLVGEFKMIELGISNDTNIRDFRPTWGKLDFIRWIGTKQSTIHSGSDKILRKVLEMFGDILLLDFCKMPLLMKNSQEWSKLAQKEYKTGWEESFTENCASD